MINLPYPPSVNHYYATVNGRRVLSKRGREYKKLAGLMMMEQGVRRGLVGPYAVTINVRPPDKRKRDLDNIVKPIFDSLTEYGAILDDSFIDDFRVQRFNPIKGGSVELLLSVI